MTLQPELLYRQICRLIETMPDLTSKPVSNETRLWLGRVYSAVSEVGNIADALSISQSSSELGHEWMSISAVQEIQNVIFRAFGVAEAKAPPGLAGTFIPVGASFDAFAAIGKVLESAKVDIMIVDPYLDHKVLNEFARAMSESVPLRLLADATYVKDSLKPAALAWINQYGTRRPLEVRVAPAKALHDRAIFVDKRIAWSLSQSLNHFAVRAPAEIFRADDTAQLKIDAYEASWSAAIPLI